MATGKIYTGVFLIALAMLLLELLLTRIWSVTMWYHFAFVAVSLAMFGMTGGALLVYLLPKFFPTEKTRLHLCLSALLFGIATVFCFLCHLAIPFMPDKSLSGIFAMALTYIVVAIPFTFSGIAITLALTRFSKQINYIYAADLAGAAFGCLLFLFILNFVDGPTAILFAGFLPVLAAIFLAPDKVLRNKAIITAVCIGSLCVLNAWSFSLNKPLVRLLWVKAAFETRPFFERWNSLSRISIDGNPKYHFAHPDWRFSKQLSENDKMKDMLLSVDSLYATGMPCFTGNYQDTEYLKHDVSFVTHYIRPNAKVLIIGVGGGRDILAALTFQQKSILAVEINSIFTDILTKTFADLSGRFALNPSVTLINDEARSFASRQKDKFDIIQLSFISTGTATGTGAYALSENSLYTSECWQMLLNHLTENGVLTCTRDYFLDKAKKPLPGELHRLISLARSALERDGIPNPQEHMICITQIPKSPIIEGLAGVTLLISKQPFSQQDVAILDKVVADNGFHYLLKPGFVADPIFQTLASGQGVAQLQEKFPTRIDAPSDDNPFFFYILRFQKLFGVTATDVGTYVTYTKAMEVLFELLVVVLMLTAGCFLLPLALTNKSLQLRRDLPLLLYFAAVGLGFMFIEVSQLQRLVIFLGHPTYSLSVVLFSLLLSSSIGSLLSAFVERKFPNRSSAAMLACLGLLLGTTATYMVISPQVLLSLGSATTAERIAASVAILFPLGLFMGMAVPFGLSLASKKSPSIMPWLWAINGATSVCASVVTVAVSINWGLSCSFWTGVACYLVAFVAFFASSRLSNQE